MIRRLFPSVVKTFFLAELYTIFSEVFVGGNIELADVLDVRKKYGKISEVSWKTFEGIAIKTGENTVFLYLDDATEKPLPKSI